MVLKRVRTDHFYLNNATLTWAKPGEILSSVLERIRAPHLKSGRTTREGAIRFPGETREEPAFFFTHDPDLFAEPMGHYL